MAVPTTLTAAVGDKITAANWNTYERDAMSFLLSPPRCYVYLTTVPSPANGVETLISWDTELYDTDTMHSTSTNASRLVATTTGLYACSFQVAWTGNATGVRGVHVRKNSAGNVASGTQMARSFIPTGNISGNSVNCVADLQMTATDYLEVFTYQSSGGALAVVGGSALTWASMRWVASS